MRKFIIEFIWYLRAPELIETSGDRREKWWLLRHGIYWNYIIGFFIGLLLVGYNFFLLHGIGFDYRKIWDMKLNRGFEGFRLGQFVFMCLLGPVLEELLFRSWLNFKKMGLALFAGAFMWEIAKLTGKWLFGVERILGVMGVSILLAILAFFLTYRFLPTAALHKVGKRYFRFWFYGSAFIFGLLHLFNVMPPTVGIMLLCIPMVLPQFVMGLIMSYVRVRNGLIWSVGLHVLINTVAFLFMLN